MTTKKIFAVALATILITGCATPPLQAPAGGHIRADDLPKAQSAGIPQPVQQSAALPKPKPSPKAETYSVVVKDVRAQELLFALARDAKLNVDIHPGIIGTVTLNAIDQTLPQLLNRIAKQIDMRYELDGPNLVVMPDTPFLRNYRIDYVNMSRDTSSTVAITTQIASTTGAASASGATTGNNSTTEVKNSAKNHFWDTLEKNIKDILRETDKILPEGSSETVVERADAQSTSGTGAPAPAGTARAGAAASLAGSPNAAALQSSGTTVVKRTTFREAASVIINPETGVILVRATARQHERVQEFLDQVAVSAKRQVLIEATIAEVRLNQNYQQGIDWQRLRLDGTGFNINQSSVGTLSSGVSQSLLVLQYTNPGSRIGNFSASVSLLDAFGSVKVLSSPKLSVLNNQTALLKVVDNVVYFEVKADSTTNQVGTNKTVTTTAKSVSVGLVMSVTPQVSESGMVILNVRPTISRVTGYKLDPNPDIPSTIQNRVPEIQTREMESLIRMNDGEIAVMGGLMQDAIDYRNDTVPGLASLPVIGNLFAHKNDTNTKTELVVFLRPVVVRDPAIGGDYRSFRAHLPDRNFFGGNPGPEQPVPAPRGVVQ